MTQKKSGKKYVTLKDVAEKCGLSISTVSKVLSGESNFKEETKDLVFQIAQDIGYAPNALARSVANKGGYKMIGFFVPNILNPFFAELVDCVEKRLTRRGYCLTLCIMDKDAKKMADFIKMLVETRAMGCIIAACREDACKDDFLRARKFMGMVSIQADIPGVDRVDVTDEEGTYEMIKYLIHKGHRKIAFSGYRFDITVLQKRLEGYYRALREAGIPIREEYIIEGKHTNVDSYQNAKKILQLPDPPTAIHCINEFVAMNTYEAIRDEGLDIPEDISVTAFDGIAISRILEPRITTVQDPVDLLAGIAVDMLMEQIEYPENDREVKQVYVRHRFVEGKSVKDLHANRS